MHLNLGYLKLGNVYFVMTLNDSIRGKFKYPEPELSESEFISTKDAIDDLPSLENCNDYSLNQKWDYISHPNTIYQKVMRKIH